MNPSEDTIAAVATPYGRGAISIVRLSGAHALEVADRVWRGKALAQAESHTAHLGFIVNPGSSSASCAASPIDQALATVFRAPHSFTGEDMVEFGLHGSPLISRMVMSALVEAGARPAGPGEFSQRAVANGRMSLVSAEAAADLVAASSRASQRIAMSQMRGGVERRLKGMQDSLLRLASLLELELDFSEEDVEFAPRTELLSLAEEIRSHLLSLQASYRTGAAIKEGIPVAIAGPTNAGKSSLLNALADDERAIVSDIHGTTRDVIEDTLTIDEYLFRFMDTAGLRDTSDPIEQIGIAHSKKALSKAHITMLVTDSALPLPRALLDETRAGLPAGATLLLLRNKADLTNTGITGNKKDVDGVEVLHVSAKTGEGISQLKTRLAEIVREEENATGEVLLTNERHYTCVSAALKALDRVVAQLEAANTSQAMEAVTPDIIAQSVREVINHLAELTGTALQTPALLQHLFSHFCIGK